MVPTRDTIVVLCTAPDDDVGARLARGLVESKLAACVNRIPVRSTYVWKGELVEETEVQLVIKTNRDRLDALGRFLEEHHPYDVPEVLALPVEAASHGYLAFIDEGTRPG